MPLPTLICPCQWEVTKKVELIEQKQMLGDGYVQYMSVGMNPLLIEWNVKTPVLTRTKVNLIVSQLETFAGYISFLWSPDNGLNEPLAGYYCDEWVVTPLAPNAFTLEATFLLDSTSESVSLATNTNTNLMNVQLEGMINFFNTYTRSTLPMVANSQGVTVETFQNVEGRYLPTSTGTSDSQTLIIDGILKARRSISSIGAKQTALNLALLYSNALTQYFYQQSIPTTEATPFSKIWLPHWLVNAKNSFISKGLLVTKNSSSGYFDTQISFTNGVGVILASSVNQGHKLSDVYKVYSIGGKLLSTNVYAPVTFGTEYSVNYWVSNPQLLGPTYRYYPSSSGNGGPTILPTTETAGTIVLNSTFTGNLIVVYSAYVGEIITINEPFDWKPFWLKLSSDVNGNKIIKNHTLYVSDYCDNAFNELYLSTSDLKWNIAKSHNKNSTVLVSNFASDHSLFKIDTTTTDPFYYPGTRLIITNNSSSTVAFRDASGWLRATISDGPEPNPVADLQNFAIMAEIQQGVTVNVNFGINANLTMEVYLSTSSNILDDTKIYTYYQPMLDNIDVNISLKPNEFIKFNTSTWWHPRITDLAIYAYQSDLTNVTAFIESVIIETYRRVVSIISMNKIVGGNTGVGFFMSNVGNEPPAIYYSKTGVQVKLKIVDSKNQSYFWTLPDTAESWMIFTPYWITADVNTNTLVGDGTIISLEIIGDVTGTSVVKIWWIGASPEILPFPCMTYKGGVISRATSAHTFKVGSFTISNSPTANLKGVPGVLPVTANLEQYIVGVYSPNAIREIHAFTGHQAPYLWYRWGDIFRFKQSMSFLIESQNAYTKQSVNKISGPFAPAYVWPIWANGVIGQINTWVWKGPTDPSSHWSSYQFRPLVSVAQYWMSTSTDLQAESIVMTFLKYIDEYFRKNKNSLLPTDFYEFVDPVTTYINIQDYALVARTALYANLAGGDTSVTYRVFKKVLDYLMSEYVSIGIMAGTFTKSQPISTQNGVVIKDLSVSQHAEIMITLSEIITYKEQMKYPANSVNLI